jgi:phage portal protein BeeE
MSFMDWLRGRIGIESPWSPDLNQAVLTYLLDVKDIDTPIDRKGAMSVPSVARIRDAVASIVAALPLNAVTRAGRLATQPAWITKPDPNATRKDTIVSIVDDLLFWGESFAVRLPGGGFRAVRRERITRVSSVTGYPVEVDGEPITDTAIRWLYFNGTRAGLLTVSRDTVRSAMAIRRTMSRYSVNPTPGTVLKYSGNAVLTTDEKEKVLSTWAEARQKPTGFVALLGRDMDVEFPGTAAESTMAVSRRESDLDIARALGAPAWLLDSAAEGSSIDYSNNLSRWTDLMSLTVGPYLTDIEARLSEDDMLGPGVVARFDRTVTMGTLRERLESYALARELNLYTIDDIRAIESGTIGE